MRRTPMLLLALSISAAALAAQARAAKTLDIYYIDAEGGQATLFVSPTGESVLVDTGNNGTRDPDRIMEAVRAAGLKQIDYLLITHYHSDHIGGYLELAKRIPIIVFVDHGPTIQPEQKSASREAYEQAWAKGRHMVAKPGDKVPITGIDWTIVTSAGSVLKTNMAGAPGAGRPNSVCTSWKPKDIQTDLENGMSTGSVITYGKFRTIDLGDLLWNVEGELMCPTNRLGTVDLYLTTHHGLDWSGSPQVVHALQPRVIIMNNGTRKGGQIASYETIEQTPGLEDFWQLHWSYNGGIEHNPPGVFIANIDDKDQLAAIVANPAGPVGNPNHSPAYWLQVSASADGSFTVTNSRNGFSKTYPPRN